MRQTKVASTYFDNFGLWAGIFFPQPQVTPGALCPLRLLLLACLCSDAMFESKEADKGRQVDWGTRRRDERQD
jgi:hypothetical protein